MAVNSLDSWQAAHIGQQETIRQFFNNGAHILKLTVRVCIYHILAKNVYLKTGFLRKNILDIYRSQINYC
jgi:hypothetical protein